MNIPLDWLKEYIDLDDKTPEQIASSFTSLGLMLEKPIENGVLDLEHRMDRSDWLSILGGARDLAAFDNKKLKYPPVHKEKGKELEAKDRVKIEIKCTDLVKRFNTRVFKNIKVGESPEWLKTRLEAYGIPAINNIVDITNYVMVEYGQPMHAQDLAKMEAREIVIRLAKDGEKIVTLLGETVKLSQDQFVLTQNDKATVIGGIVGGNTTGVDETTTEIVLDAGNYDQNNIRKSSRALKIQNETVLRYDKFLHPELTQAAIERATYLILDLAGGEYYENEDWYPEPAALNTMRLNFDRVKKIGGMDIEVTTIKRILEALEYKIIAETSDGFDLEIPYFRTDVVVEDDIVADIYRINDYSKIPVTMIAAAPPKEITPKSYKLEQKLRDLMVGIGYHEHITDPLIPTDEKLKEQVVLENALTADKSALRLEISETLKEVMKTYKKHKLTEIKLFEIGRVYKKAEGKYVEEKMLETIYENTESKAYDNVKVVKTHLAALLQQLGIGTYQIAESGEITVGENIIGKLNQTGFAIHIEKLDKHLGNPLNVTSEIHTYTKENLSLVMDLNAKFGKAYEAILNSSDEIVDLNVIEEYTGEKVGANKKTILVEISYTTSDTQEIRKGLIEMLANDFGIQHREK